MCCDWAWVLRFGKLRNVLFVCLKDLFGVHGMLPKQYFGEDQCFLAKHSSSDNKLTVVDASQLFKKPHRSTRPDNFVIILRGLPGINSFVF